jgi:TRAP-type C4-dicarboxylate transport system permease small subunit
MKLLQKSQELFDKIINLLAVLAATIILFVTLAVCADIILRNFLHKPLVWVFETTEYLLLYMTFLGAAWVLKREGHVHVDILINKLSRKAQARFGVITSMIGIIICGAFVVYGSEVTWDYFARGVVSTKSLLGFPYAPVLMIIPIGSFFLLLQFVRRTYGYMRTLRALSKQT